VISENWRKLSKGEEPSKVPFRYTWADAWNELIRQVGRVFDYCAESTIILYISRIGIYVSCIGIGMVIGYAVKQ